MGLEKPEEGLVSLGNHNIIPNYFEQNQSEVSYKQEIEEEMTEFCKNLSLNFAPESLIFNCKSN